MDKIDSGKEWNNETLEQCYMNIERIAVEQFKADCYKNQIEIITAEQMLDAYSSVGLPMYYNHWSFGKSFITNHDKYQRGYQGLAYEIVINSNPCISYLMEENTMGMQALVMAHACFGHNHFFKNNYLFKQWTDAESIIDYLVFAKKFIQDCEEKYGEDTVEALLDNAHALQYHGIDKYKRPRRLSVREEKEKTKEREAYLQSQLNDLWRTVPNFILDETGITREPKFPPQPQENILYFLEKHAPQLDSWEREILRIVRKLAQYFYPQMQTQVMNEGFACVTGDTLVDTPNGLLYARNIVNTRYIENIDDGHDDTQCVIDWFDKHNKPRVKIQLKNGFSLHGGLDHKILINDNWVELQNIKVGDELPIVRGRNQWPHELVMLPNFEYNPRMTIIEACNHFGVHTKTYYKWMNNTGFVSDSKALQCKEVFEYMQQHQQQTSANFSTRNELTFPKYLTEQYAYWLGLIVGDGGIHEGSHKKVYFVTGDVELRDWFVAATTLMFGIVPTIRADRNHWVININSNSLVEYLKNTFAFPSGKTSDVKVVPPQILISPSTVVAAFIRGHMDTDGCADKQSGNVILISKSKELINTEQQILLKMGIVGSTLLQQADQCYRLTITGNDTVIFRDLIGFTLTRKQQILDQHISSKTRFLTKNDTSSVVEVLFDEGDVYDFSVSNTHQYKASCFINHNCFMHYHIINKMYDEKLVTDGFMLEFLKGHTNVVAQPLFYQPHYSGINPYALGFNMMMDIKRICLSPTDEDKQWFPDFAGNPDWNSVIHYAVKNFTDESFISQYLSPTIIRKFRLFSILDDERDPMLEVAAIHNEQGYKEVRADLARQYSIGFKIPDIQIVNVNRWGDRSMTLEHRMYNGRPLDQSRTFSTLQHLSRLWGYKTTLNSVDPITHQIKTTFEASKTNKALSVSTK